MLITAIAAFAAALVACGDNGGGAVADARAADAPGASDASAIDAPLMDAGPPALSLDLPVVDFGSRQPATTSAPMTVTVTNTGCEATGELDVTLAGSGAASFATTGTTCTGALAPGATCTVPVTFTPSTIGALTATLHIAASPGGSATATLEGVGVGSGPAMLAITSDANMLGSAVIGTVGSAAVTFTVTDVGGDMTGALRVDPTGADPADFIVDDACSTRVLAPGGVCTFVVRLAPTGRGVRAAAFEVSSAPGSGVTGTVAGIGLAPAVLTTRYVHRDLGTIGAGSAAIATLTFINTGDVATSEIGASLDAPSGFAYAGGSCVGSSLAPGATCTVLAQLSSTTPGATSAELTMLGLDGGTDGGAPLHVALTGFVTPGNQLAIAPSLAELVDAPVGGSGAAQTFTITNRGSAASGALALTSSDASFAIAQDGCTAQVLAPDGTCTFATRFSPSQAAALHARLAVTSPAAGTTSATVIGVGLAPASLELSQTARGFGAVVATAAGASSDATFTVTNTGDQASSVPSVAITGLDAAVFTSNNNCTTALAPGAACTIAVRFAPASQGARSATLDVTAASGGSTTASLSGAGIAAGGLTITPPGFDFGVQPVLAKSTMQSFVVRNTGSAAIADLAVAGDATFVAPGALDSSCGTALAPGASCVVSATYQPTAVAASVGAITATGGGSAAFASVCGASQPLFELSAIDSVAAGGATRFDFGAQSVSLGSAAAPDDTFVTLAGQSSAYPDLIFEPSFGSPAQFAIIGDDCAGVITAGRTCTIQLRFTPTQPGPQSGSITFRMQQFEGSAAGSDLPPFILTGSGAP